MFNRVIGARDSSWKDEAGGGRRPAEAFQDESRPQDDVKHLELIFLTDFRGR